MTGQPSPDNSSAKPLPSKKRKRNPASSSDPRKPRQKQVECPICLTFRSPNLIVTLSACNCTYCVSCLREVFSSSLEPQNGASKFPARCCGRIIDHVEFGNHLTPNLRRAYKAKIEEMKSNNPLYCANSACRAFIFGEYTADGFGLCKKCKMKTCTRQECNKLRSAHLGINAICPSELEDEDLQKLAAREGWKRCPKCFALTERIRGCDSMR